MSLDLTALTAVLKVQYTQKKVNTLAYDKNPFWAMVKKRTDFLGVNKVVAIRNGQPQGRGADFTTAIANVSPSVYNRFTVTRSRDYAFARVFGEAVEASAKDAGSLLQGLKNEIDGAIYTATRSIAVNLFGNGGGARGQIASGQATATVTLTRPEDTVNFEVGMYLKTSTADGTSGSLKAGRVQVTGVDRVTGTVTASGNWTAGIATAAANDFIFQEGDNVSNNSMLAGLGAWIPSTTPTSTAFFGLDRSTDPVRLGGVRYSAGSGGPIEEILIDTAALLVREGSRPDTVFLNPLDYANLIKALSGKVLYDRSRSFDMPDIGFEAVKLMGPAGPMKVLADLNCPRGRGYMLQLDTWTFESLGGAPKILNLDGQDMLRDATADAYIIRVGYYGNLTCEAPGWNAVFTL
jgi:hypothetical protein